MGVFLNRENKLPIFMDGGRTDTVRPDADFRSGSSKIAKAKVA